MARPLTLTHLLRSGVPALAGVRLNGMLFPMVSVSKSGGVIVLFSKFIWLPLGSVACCA